MKQIITVIDKHATGGKVLLFLVIQLMMQSVFVFLLSPRFRSFSEGLEAPDLSPFYGPGYLEKLLASTSESGLQYYLQYFFTLDLIFPLLYGLSYALIAAYLLRKLDLLEMKYQWLILLPFASALFDYGENFGMAALIISQPEFSRTTAQITTVFSALKAGSAFAGISTLVVLALTLMAKKVIRKQRRRS